MNFNSWDLGQQPAGAIVQVTLSGNAANVRLFDGTNFSSFKAGRRATGLRRSRHPLAGSIASAT